jgi:hypothetical protein
MKKITLFMIATIMVVAAFGQSKAKTDTIAVDPSQIEAVHVDKSGKIVKDTTIQVVLSLDKFKMLLYSIDTNIDSKKASKEIIQFLQQSARLLEAEKPKALPKADKPPGK